MKLHIYKAIAILTALAPLCHAKAPATGPDLPHDKIGAIYQDAKSQPGDKAGRIRKNTEILAACRQLIADHPEVPPTATYREITVRRMMLPAAERLYRDDPSDANREQLKAIATQVATSSVTEGHLIEIEKPRAGMIVTRLEIYPNDDDQPVDAAKHIRAFIEQFPVQPDLENSEAMHGQALVYAAQLAAETNESTLSDELSEVIIDKYLGARGAINTLISLGNAVPFEAELTTLDGTTLRFPEDTKGKVVVVDFWATWCGPCIASLPHMKEIHDNYKDRGVMVIGVSCDTPTSGETRDTNKQKVATVVSKKKLDWTQTWSGEWPAPAVKYGVSSIPTVFIIGKDGNILTTAGRGREEHFIQQALNVTDAR